MSEQVDELKKLESVATDAALSAKIRVQAIELMGKLRTYEALQALLNLAANERLTKKERELALKHAGGIIRAMPG